MTLMQRTVEKDLKEWNLHGVCHHLPPVWVKSLWRSYMRRASVFPLGHWRSWKFNEKKKKCVFCFLRLCRKRVSSTFDQLLIKHTVLLQPPVVCVHIHTYTYNNKKYTFWMNEREIGSLCNLLKGRFQHFSSQRSFRPQQLYFLYFKKIQNQLYHQINVQVIKKKYKIHFQNKKWTVNGRQVSECGCFFRHFHQHFPANGQLRSFGWKASWVARLWGFYTIRSLVYHIKQTPVWLAQCKARNKH